MRASGPLLAGRGATEAVVAGTGSRRVVVAWDRKREGPTQGSREAGMVDSRRRAVGVAWPLALSRCRVPYWPDALPWRRELSRDTAGLRNKWDEAGEEGASGDESRGSSREMGTSRCDAMCQDLGPAALK